MPVARYFLYTGGVLLALLFLLDWYLPPPAVEAARADIDRSTIRLQSAHKWPSAVVFDTNQPTIVPPAAVAAVAPAPPPPKSPAKPPLDALAMAQPKEPAAVHAAPPAARKRVARRTTRVARTPAPAAPRVASYDMFGFGTPFRMGW
ncbi:hypothetical protein JQ628_09120 [Bradyrhizobium lablabi]|uniref:hypothetical protein n=1 Tax=Bradyrhizobium lablabi TaxID=722472 RepID=UPI001BA98D73|nr:hypothetical protein [Bradyrhizobium lablabi]MBR1121668.1 hypothetical protein [Bradyrhizobium lablabi]